MSTTTWAGTRSGTSGRPVPQTQQAPRLREETGVRYGLGHAWLCLAVLVTHGLGLPDPVVLVVAVGVVLASSRGLGTVPTVALGIAAWAVWTGFVEHRLGVLTLAPHDLGRLGLVVAVCAVATCVARRRGRDDGGWARLAPW